MNARDSCVLKCTDTYIYVCEFRIPCHFSVRCILSGQGRCRSLQTHSEAAQGASLFEDKTREERCVNIYEDFVLRRLLAHSLYSQDQLSTGQQRKEIQPIYDGRLLRS